MMEYTKLNLRVHLVHNLWFGQVKRDCSNKVVIEKGNHITTVFMGDGRLLVTYFSSLKRFITSHSHSTSSLPLLSPPLREKQIHILLLSTA